MDEKILEVKQVSKTFCKGKKTALQDITLQFTPGIYGLFSTRYRTDTIQGQRYL